MGVPGLWPVLAPSSTPVSLHSYVTENGALSQGKRRLIIGIDASGWIRALTAAGRHQHSYQSKNVPLASTYARLMRLLQTGALPVLVFDGPKRPRLKCNTQVRGDDHWIVKEIKTMLRHLGLPWCHAPGEAEAELAGMSRAGIIDAVLTEDSDALVFGATVVLRDDPDHKDKDRMLVYRHDTLATDQDHHLQRDDLILIALLAGGDYDAGLEGCGVAIACDLAHAGLGAALVQGIKDIPPASWPQHLASWRSLLRGELASNQSGRLRRVHVKLAAKVPDSFPDLDVLRLYLDPIVSSSMPTPTDLVWQPPQITGLVQFAEHSFSWSTPHSIFVQFSHSLFPALALHQLLNAALALDRGQPPSSVACSMIKGMVGTRTSACGDDVRLQLQLESSLLDKVESAVLGVFDVAADEDDKVKQWRAHEAQQLRIWAPRSLVEFVLPDSVTAGPKYKGRRAEKRTHRHHPYLPQPEAGPSRTQPVSPTVSRSRRDVWKETSIEGNVVLELTSESDECD